MNSSQTPRPSMQTWWQTLRLREVALGTIVVMLVVLGFAFLLAIRTILIAVFLGILLATALRPVVQGLQVSRMPRAVAASIAVLLLVLAGLSFVLLVVPPTAQQLTTLAQNTPAMYDTFRESLANSRYLIVRQFGLNLQQTLSLDEGLFSERMLTSALSWLPVVGYWFFGGVSTLLFTYYWLIYRERSVRSMLLLLPIAYRDRVEALWIEIEVQIGAFLRGQILLGVVVGVISLIGYWLIGMPYALLLAIVAGILELVPYVGPILTAVVAITTGFSISFSLGMSAVLVGVVVQMVENAVLVPRIMDRTVGVSPVVILLALAGFAAIFGLGGALLAIPLAAVGQILFQAWMEQREGVLTATEVDGRSLGARVRYQTQHLLQDVRMHLRHKEREASAEADVTEEELEAILENLDALLKEHEREPA